MLSLPLSSFSSLPFPLFLSFPGLPFLCFLSHSLLTCGQSFFSSLSSIPFLSALPLCLPSRADRLTRLPLAVRSFGPSPGERLPSAPLYFPFIVGGYLLSLCWLSSPYNSLILLNQSRRFSPLNQSSVSLFNLYPLSRLDNQGISIS